jgi:multidrug efflux pump subunit AcrB
MNSLPDLAIRYKTIVITIVTLLVVWGVISFNTMPRREDPKTEIRDSKSETNSNTRNSNDRNSCGSSRGGR